MAIVEKDGVITETDLEGNAVTYNFASVGQPVNVVSSQLEPVSGSFSKPIGILTPVSLGYGSAGLFEMSKDYGKQVSDNFRNMIATNHGERLGYHDFGANLLPLVFDLMSEGADVTAIRRIKATTEKYMPFVQLDTFESFKEQPLPQYLAKSGVRITYSVPTLGLVKQVVEVIIYAGA